MQYSAKLEQTVKMMFNLFGSQDKERLKSYLLVLSSEDENRICGNILNLLKTFEPKHTGHIPSIADILKVEVDNDELQNAWKLFEKECHERYKPISDINYTIKQIIGENRVNMARVDEWKWIEKEFKENYAKIKNNQFQLREDPKKQTVKQLQSGVYYLPPQPERDKARIPQRVDATPYFQKMREMLGMSGKADA